MPGQPLPVGGTVMRRWLLALALLVAACAPLRPAFAAAEDDYFELCRAYERTGWNPGTDEYGLKTLASACGNFPYSKYRGGTTSGAADYLIPTTAEGNAFTMTCTAVGVGVDDTTGEVYDTNAFLQAGGDPLGRAASGGTTSTLTDSAAKAFTGGNLFQLNGYADHVIELVSGAGSPAKRLITANTRATTAQSNIITYTISGTWPGASPDTTTRYRIYDPMGSICKAPGERAVVNFMADAMLAQDHVLPTGGGTIYFPKLPNATATLYVQRGCGRRGSYGRARANNCPVLRPPNDEHYQRAIQQLGTVRWVGESDPDWDADANGRRGVWFIDDTGSITGGTLSGRDPGGPVPMSFSFSRSPFRMGPNYSAAAGDRVCSKNSAGKCQPALSSNDSVSVNAWGRTLLLNHASELTDSQAVCVSNSVPDSGTCRGDRRVVCGADADCTNVATSGPCDSAAAAIEYEVETLRQPMDVLLAYAQLDFPEAGTAINVPAEANRARIIDAPRASCGGSNQTVSFGPRLWPARSSVIPVGTGGMYALELNEMEGNLTGGLENFTWSQNNYYRYDADGDGISDPGDCLSGLTAASLTDDEPECDDAEGPTLYGGFRHKIENVVLANCSTHPDGGGFSCFDGDTASFGHFAKRIVFQTPRRGYLTDLSDVRMENVRVENCTTGEMSQGMNVSFVSVAEFNGLSFSHCIMSPLVSMAVGRQFKARDVEFIGTTGIGFGIRRGNSVTLEQFRFASHKGPWVAIEPVNEIGTVNILNFSGSGQNEGNFSQAAYPAGFFFFGRAFQTSGWENPVRNVNIRNVSIETSQSSSCGIFFDDDVTPTEGPIDITRANFTIENFSMDGLNGATGLKPVCVDTVCTGEAGDCCGNCNAGTEQGIFTHKYLPVMRNVKVDGVPWGEQPWPTMPATAPITAAGDCDDTGRTGSVVRIVNDTAGGACADGGADGVLDGGGSAVSICKCLPSTSWAAY